MTRKETRLLPVVEWAGREFLVDIASRQFRNVNDPDDSVAMHSPQGRAIVRQMQGTQWSIHAVDSGGQEDAAV